MDFSAQSEDSDTAASEGPNATPPNGQLANASAQEQCISKLDQGWRKIVRNFTPSYAAPYPLKQKSIYTHSMAAGSP
jgi:hypothetical protein